MTSGSALAVDAALDIQPWLRGTSSGTWPGEVKVEEVGGVDFRAIVDPADQATLRDVVAAALAKGRGVTVEYRRAGTERWWVEELRPLRGGGYATVLRSAGAEALVDPGRSTILGVVAHELSNLRFLLRSSADAAAKGEATAKELQGDLAHVIDRCGVATGTLMVLAGRGVDPSEVEVLGLVAGITKTGRQIFEQREVVVTSEGPSVKRRIERPRFAALVAALLARGLRRPDASEPVTIRLTTAPPDRFELTIQHPSRAPFSPSASLSERTVVTDAKALGLDLALELDGARLTAR
jgi:hypothetical protein